MPPLFPPDEEGEPAPPEAVAATPEPQPIPEQPFAFAPLQTELPTYELTIPSEAMSKFAADPWTPEQPARFTYEGQSLPAMVRLRGASARTFPKKSWNVDFEQLRFQGREELNLIAEYQDSTMMAEKLAYDLLEAMGVPSPRARYVRLVVNGRYQGVYVDLEEVDKRFLSAHGFADGDANIYRCGWKDCEMKTWKVPYQGDWKKQTNKLEGSEDLTALLDAINHTPEPLLAQTLGARLELSRLLRSMAADALVSNNYIEDSESYLVHDRVTGRWSYVPWDLNNADSRFWHTYTLGAKPIVKHPLVIFSLTDAWVDRTYQRRKGSYSGYLPVFSNLNTRVALNRELREALLATIEKALRELFTLELAHSRIDAMHALISPHMAADPYVDQAKFRAGAQYLKDFVTGRRAFLEEELARLRGHQPTLVIAAFDPRAGWVELANRGAAPVELGGLVLTTNLRRPFGRNVPTRTLGPGQSARLTAQQLGLTFAERGELGLFDGNTVVGLLDALFYGPLEPGKHYARSETSASGWEIR